MKIIHDDHILRISEIQALTAANSQTFGLELAGALASTVNQIELDLSKANFMDCGGVGALVALRNRARKSNAAGTIRVLNPAGPAHQMLRLTRMDALFPIERR
jgi:anti-anti-sigma factor